MIEATCPRILEYNKKATHISQSKVSQERKKLFLHQLQKSQAKFYFSDKITQRNTLVSRRFSPTEIS